MYALFHPSLCIATNTEHSQQRPFPYEETNSEIIIINIIQALSIKFSREQQRKQTSYVNQSMAQSARQIVEGYVQQLTKNQMIIAMLPKQSRTLGFRKTNAVVRFVTSRYIQCIYVPHVYFFKSLELHWHLIQT